jgi:tellurite resistance protein
MLQAVERTQAASSPEAVLTAHRSPEQPRHPGGWRQVEAVPVGLFAAVMGLAGLNVAWTLAHARYGTPLWVATGLGLVACAAFVAVAAAYTAKSIIAWPAVRAEFRHPIAGNLFGTPLISLLLLPIPLASLNLALARVSWSLGAIGMTLFAWLIVTRWLSDRQQVVHATPAWIVPVVGLLDVPLALPVLGLPPMQGVMVFALAVGLFFALPLFTLIMSRLLFEAPLPAGLQPSLLILVAPFAVGCSAYVATTGAFDLFAEALFAVAVFLASVLLPKLARFGRACPFRVSWWGVSFPLAATAVAALRVATALPGLATDILALSLLTLATLVIGWLSGRTLVGLVRGELRTLAL